jgi:hypothetical protein
MIAKAITALSLGAGVQSTTLLLKSCLGELPHLDYAIFADTGGELPDLYAHLDRLRATAAEAGTKVLLVAAGNLADDAVNPGHRYASIPYHIQNKPGPCQVCGATGRKPPADPGQPAHDGGKCPHCRGTGWDDGKGMGRRQCTSEYKLTPIYRKIRELLGAPPPAFRRVPKGRTAKVWIGFSTDELGRVNDRAPQYMELAHPLLDLGMNRKACERWLARRGWDSVAKSACYFCPYNGNRRWRELRDNHPEEWQKAVEFDHAIRQGGARGEHFRGEAFLHRSMLPLEEAPIGRVTRAEWKARQGDMLELIAEADEIAAEDGHPDGCGPFSCRSGEPERRTA